MIQKKICMLGAFAVGKTSLVRQYVESIFSEKYQTTIGVKVDKKEVRCDGRTVTLLLWDIQGQEAFLSLTDSYLRGAAGYLLVIDGTRPETLKTAIDIHERTVSVIGEVPFYVLFNKSDLFEEWGVTAEHLKLLRKKKWPVLNTSAKTGQGVDEAFNLLTELVSVHPQ